MLQERDDIVALDSAILQHPRVWEASGHLEGFTDPLVDCRTCKLRFRADKLEDGRCGQKPSKLPGEGPDCDLTEARAVQPDVRDPDRPGRRTRAPRSTCARRRRRASSSTSRTCSSSRASRPPFGIAQVGKSFRNEITPGNFVFRTREFEQMEMEFFVPAGARPSEWYERWIEIRRAAGTSTSGSGPTTCGCAPTRPTSSPITPRRTSDVEYLFPIGWSELEGIANRGDFDLSRHAEFSGEKLEYFDQETKERYVPHVIEPAAGADRATLAFLVDAYDTEEVEGRQRTVLRLHPRLAPVKVAVLPLVSKEGMPERAREIYEGLRARLPAEFDEGGSIGKRYRRQDEIGTPWGITVDGQTMEDETVTLRDRDSLEQVRVPVEGLAEDLARRLDAPWH